jgi:acetaldehyde dehydrogenase/alcohol dehydrogenase
MFQTDSVNLCDTEHIDAIIFQSISAIDSYIHMEQSEIDKIVSHMARVAHSQHLRLARMIVDETGCGIIEDKAVENIFSSSGLEGKLRSISSVASIEEYHVEGYQMIAEPIGILAAFPPVTNSVATILFQAILSVKTRNPIIFSFHPSVWQSSLVAAQLMQEAASEAGAPAHTIQWLTSDSEQAVSGLLASPEISCILMDGDHSLLSSESFPNIPILGTGLVNTPCFIDRSADIERAATDVVSSKYFDNGLVSTAEQTVIICREIYFQTLDLMMQKSCYLANEQEKKQLEQLLFDSDTGIPHPECRGLNAVVIAKMAGFSIPAQTKLILVEIGGIGPLHPLSRPKDFPVLAVLACESWYEGLCFCEALLEFSSSLHMAVLHARDKKLVSEFASKLKVSHLLVNRPATRGDLAEFTVFRGGNLLTTTMEKQAGNIATAPFCLDMLLSRRMVLQPKIRRREWKVPENILYSPDSIFHLESINSMERTLIVTEKELVNSACMDQIILCLNNKKFPVKIDFFCNTEEVATIAAIEDGLQCIKQFRPTALLAVGNSCTMDIAKAMNYFYHRPDDSVSEVLPDFGSADFPDFADANQARQVILATVPVTPGSGAEMNGVVTLFNDSREKRCRLQSFDLIPDVCLIDSRLSLGANREEMALTGMNILSSALEAYVSPLASDFSDSMAVNAIQLIFKYLVTAVNSQHPMAAREKIYNAAAMTGMATSNAKTGLSLAMTHSLVAMFRLSPDVSANLLLPHIVKYNGVEDPTRYNPLTPGSRYCAHERYQEIAKHLGLSCSFPEQGVESLLSEIGQLQQELELPHTINAYGISEPEYLCKVKQMADQVFEDHSTATNPRLPLLGEIEALFNALRL